MKYDIAPVKNIAKLQAAYEALSTRDAGIPGMGLVYGHTGAGKTTGITRMLLQTQGVYQKQPGAIEIDDEALTIKRIKKLFADQEDMLQQLIKTTEKPVKDALGGLSGDQLKKLGVRVAEDTEKIIIKSADSEVDKIVNALLKGATDAEA